MRFINKKREVSPLAFFISTPHIHQLSSRPTASDAASRRGTGPRPTRGFGWCIVGVGVLDDPAASGIHAHRSPANPQWIIICCRAGCEAPACWILLVVRGGRKRPALRIESIIAGAPGNGNCAATGARGNGLPRRRARRLAMTVGEMVRIDRSAAVEASLSHRAGG